MASFKWPPQAGGSGTVTSVGLTVPSSILSVSGSPVTSSGVLAVSLVPQSANTVWAGPASGGPATPTFRVLVTADLPFSIGNLTDVGTDGITVTGGTGAVIGSGTSLSQHVSDATHNGYLANTDWVIFNGKQPAGNYITALTGDGTASGPGSVALTLATVNLNVGSFGTASSVGSFTVNGKGLVTAAANTSIQIAESQVTNLISDLAGKQPVGNYITALTGDVTASGPGSVAASLTATTNATLVTLSALSLPTSQLSGTISLTTQVSGVLPEVNGGTHQSSYTTGDTLYASAANTLSKLPIGTTGQVLAVSGGLPSWQTAAATSIVSLMTNFPTSSITGSFTDVTTWTNVVEDTDSAFNASTGVYTVPVAGLYCVSVNFTVAGTFIQNGVVQVAVVQNGTQIVIPQTRTLLAETAINIPLVKTLRCAINDTINIQIQSDGSANFINDQDDFMDIYRIGS